MNPDLNTPTPPEPEKKIEPEMPLTESSAPSQDNQTATSPAESTAENMPNSEPTSMPTPEPAPTPVDTPAAEPSTQPPIEAGTPAAPTPLSTNPSAPTSEDPGKKLGIVGFVLAFLVSLAGLIISIIALRKSKKAGFNNGLALAGIIISIVNTVIAVGVAITLMLSAYNGVSVISNAAAAACNNQNDVGQVVVQGITYYCGSASTPDQ